MSKMTMKQFQAFLAKCTEKKSITKVTPTICPANSKITAISIQINSAIFHLKAEPNSNCSLEQKASECLQRLEKVQKRLLSAGV